MMEYEDYSFPEAVQYLADRAGIKLPESEESPEERRKQSFRERLYQVNKEAGRYYYYALRDRSGEKALAYLKGRGLLDNTMRAFGLGYAKTGTNISISEERASMTICCPKAGYSTEMKEGE